MDLKSFRKHIFFYFSLVIISHTVFAWYYIDWKHRTPILISNQGNTTLTEYQILVNVTYHAGMNSNFSDLRFTWLNESTSGEEEIPYWIEDYENSSWAYVWIKVPKIPSSGNSTVYMYYGNSNASSESNGTAVFDFFDDLEDASKWSLYNCNVVDRVLNCAQGGSDYSVENVKQIPMYNIVLESKMWTNDNDGPNAGWDFGIDCTTGGDSDGACSGNMYLISLEAANYYKIWKHSGTTWTNIRSIAYTMPANQWHRVNIEMISGGTIKTYVDGSLIDSFTDSSPLTDDGGYLAIREWEGKVDWVLVRKYTNPEPNYTLENPQFLLIFHFPVNYSGDINGTLFESGETHRYPVESDKNYTYYSLYTEDVTYPNISFHNVKFSQNSTLNISTFIPTIPPESLGISDYLRNISIQPNFSFKNYTLEFRNLPPNIKAFVCKSNCDNSSSWILWNISIQNNSALLTLSYTDPLVILGTTNTSINIIKVSPEDGFILDSGSNYFYAIVTSQYDISCTLEFNGTIYNMAVTQIDNTTYNCTYSLNLAPGNYSFRIFANNSYNSTSTPLISITVIKSSGIIKSTPRAPEYDSVWLVAFFILSGIVFIKIRG